MLAGLVTFYSCEKFLGVDLPVNNINAADVYASDAMAASVATGWYQTMSNQNSAFFNSTGLLATMYTNMGLAADELVYTGTSILSSYYKNNLSATDPAYWSDIYPVIYKINVAIEGLEQSTTLSPAVKQQLLGEAKFMRAFNYSYLVGLYGDVPLVLGTDYRINSRLLRSPVSVVYHQIINDLKEAQNLLSDQYLQGDALTPYTSGAQRVRPTKWAATALLARVYLYTHDYSDADIQASLVINHTGLYRLTALSNVFLKNSREAIWQLQPVGVGINANTGEGRFFILPPTGPDDIHPVYLRRELLNNFEAGDQRKLKWISYVTVNDTTRYYYPAKYKIGAVNTAVKEYPTILRLAELYLVRAEARAQLNNLQGAVADVNIIRGRAGLPGINTLTQSEVLQAVLQERRVELFTEWGHRWFDLVRTGSADVVLGSLKGEYWHTTDQLFPIPGEELAKSPQIQQNAGY